MDVQNGMPRYTRSSITIYKVLYTLRVMIRTVIVPHEGPSYHNKYNI